MGSEEFPVFLGNYVASDVAFPDPVGMLGFDVGDFTGRFQFSGFYTYLSA